MHTQSLRRRVFWCHKPENVTIYSWYRCLWYTYGSTRVLDRALLWTRIDPSCTRRNDTEHRQDHKEWAPNIPAVTTMTALLRFYWSILFSIAVRRA